MSSTTESPLLPTTLRSARLPAQRISLSIPADVCEGLEKIVLQRGYENRSQAVTEILRHALIHEKRRNPATVMAGTICLFYDESRPGLRDRVSLILRQYLKEVVSSLGVMLEKGQRMEVLVVQGPVGTLDELVADLNACRGLETGALSLSSAILPPLHNSPQAEENL